MDRVPTWPASTTIRPLTGAVMSDAVTAGNSEWVSVNRALPRLGPSMIG